MEYIKSKLSDDLAKKILGSKENAIAYLLRLNEEKTVSGLKFKTINRGKNKGTVVPGISSDNIWKIVVDNWDYDLSKKIVRDLFKETEKYKNGKDANAVMDLLIKEWETVKLGKIEWSFSQGDFDGFVAKNKFRKIRWFCQRRKS